MLGKIILLSGGGSGSLESAEEGGVGLGMARGCEVLVCLAGVLVLSYGNTTDTRSTESIQDVVKVSEVFSIDLFL